MIGEPFYAETSSIDELMDDMCMVLRHLELLAIEHAQHPRPGTAPIATDWSCRFAVTDRPREATSTSMR